MRRRDLLTMLSVLALRLPAEAKPSGRPARVGVLWHGRDAEQEAPFQAPLLEGFARLGYALGRDVRFEHRYAGEQYDRFAALAQELVGLDPDVIVAVTRPAAAAAKAATTTIPIVFIALPDPVGSGLVDSLARPGHNITGLSNVGTDLTSKRLEILKEAVPDMRRVALLLNPGDAPLARRFLDDSREAAARLGLEVFPIEARAPEDPGRAFAAIDSSTRRGS